MFVVNGALSFGEMPRNKSLVLKSVYHVYQTALVTGFIKSKIYRIQPHYINMVT